jgi:hypothetical protein
MFEQEARYIFRNYRNAICQRFTPNHFNPQKESTMFTTTANSARIWGFLFGALALFSVYDLATAKGAILIPALGLAGFGGLAVAHFFTSKRLAAAGQSPSKASSIEVAFLALGIVAILVRMYFRYVA